MADVTVSFRIDKSTHSMMKMHDEINWSAIIRKTVVEKLRQLNSLDKEKALNTARNIDKLRKKKIFDNGGSAAQIIREWRDKRK